MRRDLPQRLLIAVDRLAWQRGFQRRGAFDADLDAIVDRAPDMLGAGVLRH